MSGVGERSGGEGEFILEETWLHKLGQLSVYKFLKTVKIKWGKSLVET